MAIRVVLIVTAIVLAAVGGASLTLVTDWLGDAAERELRSDPDGEAHGAANGAAPAPDDAVEPNQLSQAPPAEVSQPTQLGQAPTEASEPEARPQAVGDWVVFCPPGERCLAFQRHVGEDNRLLLALSFRSADNGAFETGFYSPLGIALADGIRLSLDGDERARVPVRVCRAGYCLAEATMLADFVDSLLSARHVRVSYRLESGEPVEASLRLAGLREALAAL
jgi:invasion protein IalB